MIEAGIYWAKFESISLDENSNTGTKSFKIKGLCTDILVQNGDSEEFIALENSEPLFAYVDLYTSPKAKTQTKKQLKALGFSGEVGSESMSLNPPDGGFKVIASYEEYEGEDRLKWRLEWVNDVAWSDAECAEWQADLTT